MREYRLLLFDELSNNYGTLIFFFFLLTQDHMGLEISKRYSSYSIRFMSAKFYEDIELPWWNTGYFFSCQSAKF